MKYLLKFSHTIVLLMLGACTASNVNTEPAQLGMDASIAEFEKVANLSGPITFKKHHVADWQVPLSGLLDLTHPKAVEAGIMDRDEAISLYVYAIKHPIYGNFLIDSGVSERMKDSEHNGDVSFIVEKAMNISSLEVLITTKELIARLGSVDGVLLTHIHIDHIMGIGDLNSEVPVYIGAGEVDSRSFEHLATRGTTDNLLANIQSLKEWQTTLTDVFGDGSLWAISSPGHTPGSTAYLVRSTSGPQLIVGDVSHTRWGWDNGVGPGSYSKDKKTGTKSLLKLKALANANQNIKVHPGHQP